MHVIRTVSSSTQLVIENKEHTHQEEEKVMRGMPGTQDIYAILAGSVLAFAGSTYAAPIPLAVDPSNVADEGIASVYETSGGGLILPVANANDTEYTADTTSNLMTITGDYLGIQIDLTGPQDLVELATYVDPDADGTDPFKNTDQVEFLVSSNNGASYTSAGFGAFTPFALGNFSYVNVLGDFSGVTNVRYRFRQAMFGIEGQRIAEVMAFVPEPSTIGLACAGLMLMVGKRRTQSHGL